MKWKRGLELRAMQRKRSFITKTAEEKEGSEEMEEKQQLVEEEERA